MKQKVSRFTAALFTIFAAMLACSTSGNATEAPTSQPPTELVAVVDTATNPPPSEIPTSGIPILHQVFPVNLPPSRNGHAGDHDSSVTANQKKSNGGDRFTFEQFEARSTPIRWMCIFPI